MTNRTDMREDGHDRPGRQERQTPSRAQAGQTRQDRVSAHRFQTDHLVIAIMAEVPDKMTKQKRADMLQRLTTEATLRSQLWPKS